MNHHPPLNNQITDLTNSMVMTLNENSPLKFSLGELYIYQVSPLILVDDFGVYIESVTLQSYIEDKIQPSYQGGMKLIICNWGFDINIIQSKVP